MDEDEEFYEKEGRQYRIQKRKNKRKNSFFGFILRNFSSKAIKGMIIGLVVVTALGGIYVGFDTVLLNRSKTNSLGFKDIGELATQVVYAGSVGVIDKSHTIFGATIPFTQSKNIFTYDTIIKAGIDFGEVDVTVNELSKEITVALPEVKVLSNEVVQDSFELYLEDESIFTPITLTDENFEMIELTQKAQQDAIDNGLLDLAKENAETMMTGFVENAYNLDDYSVTFVDK